MNAAALLTTSLRSTPYHDCSGYPVSHRMSRKRNINRQQKRPFAGRAQQRASSAPPRREPQDSHNARRNYERYMALAQAQFQAGDRVAAENYYQYAEHYFRLSSDRGAT